jgi:hypothetical protein
VIGAMFGGAWAGPGKDALKCPVRAALGVGLAAALPAGAAQAQQEWRFQLTPYVWGPNLTGEVTPSGRLPSLEFSESLSDILQDLDAAVFLNGTARRGRFLLFADLTYSDLSRSESWFIPATLITPEIDIEVDVEFKLTMATLAAGYTVVEEPKFALDLLAGARIWSADLTVDVPNRIGFLPDSFSESGAWGDPIIGARARYAFDPAWSVIAYADFGGFELSNGSESTWQAVGTINYGINELWFVSAGYRALGVDYSDSGLDIDVTLGGPIVGVTARF